MFIARKTKLWHGLSGDVLISTAPVIHLLYSLPFDFFLQWLSLTFPLSSEHTLYNCAHESRAAEWMNKPNEHDYGYDYCPLIMPATFANVTHSGRPDWLCLDIYSELHTRHPHSWKAG